MKKKTSILDLIFTLHPFGIAILFLCTTFERTWNFETFSHLFCRLAISSHRSVLPGFRLFQIQLEVKEKGYQSSSPQKQFKRYKVYCKLHPLLGYVGIAVTSVKSEGSSPFGVLPIHFTHKTCRCFWNQRRLFNAGMVLGNNTSVAKASFLSDSNTSWEPRWFSGPVHGSLNTWRIIPVSK